jgi:hypothetical protein
MTDHHENIGILPEHMREPVLDYIDKGYPVGSFLTALLSNDLRRTFECADDINGARVRDFVRFLYCHAPANCWGSPERVEAWQAQGGLERVEH